MSLPLAPAAIAAATVVTTKGMDFAGSLLTNAGKAALHGNPVRSLAEIAKPARVEPLVLVEKDLGDQPYMEDILKLALSTFTGYYLQAVSLMININRIETLRVLDSLNPQRSGLFADVGKTRAIDAVFSKESYEHGLPSFEALEEPIHPHLIVSIEEKDEAKGPSVSGGSVGDDSVKRIYEVENLAVGKIVNVEFKEDKETVKIPVMVRLVTSLIPGRVLNNILTTTSKRATWKERWHLWRAGQIRFVRDLMFSMDIIDEHRKTLINDTSNVYMTMMDRRRNNSIKAAATGAPSMADASNIVVISKSLAREVGRTIGGKLDSVRTRKQIFDSSYLILLIVVDEEWERVTIYHRGLDQASEFSFKEIKNTEKGKGPDITDILKAYSLGSTPTI